MAIDINENNVSYAVDDLLAIHKNASNDFSVFEEELEPGHGDLVLIEAIHSTPIGQKRKADIGKLPYTKGLNISPIGANIFKGINTTLRDTIGSINVMEFKSITSENGDLIIVAKDSNVDLALNFNNITLNKITVGDGTYQKFTNIEKIKLNGIEEGADVTGVYNVTQVHPLIAVNEHMDLDSSGMQIDQAVSLSHEKGFDTTLGVQEVSIDMGSHRIVDLGFPIDGYDAVNKQHLDDRLNRFYDFDYSNQLFCENIPEKLMVQPDDLFVIEDSSLGYFIKKKVKFSALLDARVGAEDTTAYHNDKAGEFVATRQKETALTGGDCFILEDATAFEVTTYTKAHIYLSDLQYPNMDSIAIHKNKNNEFGTGILQKDNPISADRIFIEDSESGTTPETQFGKKYIEIGSLPQINSDPKAVHFVNEAQYLGEFSSVPVNEQNNPLDYFLIEKSYGTFAGEKRKIAFNSLPISYDGEAIHRQGVNELFNTPEITSPDPSDYVIIEQHSDLEENRHRAKVKMANLPTSGGGEANSGFNLGTGIGLFKDKTGILLNFNSLNQGTVDDPINFYLTTDTIYHMINVPAMKTSLDYYLSDIKDDPTEYGYKKINGYQIEKWDNAATDAENALETANNAWTWIAVQFIGEIGIQIAGLVAYNEIVKAHAYGEIVFPATGESVLYHVYQPVVGDYQKIGVYGLNIHPDCRNFLTVETEGGEILFGTKNQLSILHSGRSGGAVDVYPTIWGHFSNDDDSSREAVLRSLASNPLDDNGDLLKMRLVDDVNIDIHQYNSYIDIKSRKLMVEQSGLGANISLVSKNLFQDDPFQHKLGFRRLTFKNGVSISLTDEAVGDARTVEISLDTRDTAQNAFFKSPFSINPINEHLFYKFVGMRDDPTDPNNRIFLSLPIGNHYEQNTNEQFYFQLTYLKNETIDNVQYQDIPCHPSFFTYIPHDYDNIQYIRTIYYRSTDNRLLEDDKTCIYILPWKTQKVEEEVAIQISPVEIEFFDITDEKKIGVQKQKAANVRRENLAKEMFIKKQNIDIPTGQIVSSPLPLLYAMAPIELKPDNEDAEEITLYWRYMNFAIDETSTRIPLTIQETSTVYEQDTLTINFDVKQLKDVNFVEQNQFIENLPYSSTTIIGDTIMIERSMEGGKKYVVPASYSPKPSDPHGWKSPWWLADEDEMMTAFLTTILTIFIVTTAVAILYIPGGTVGVLSASSSTKRRDELTEDDIVETKLIIHDINLNTQNEIILNNNALLFGKFTVDKFNNFYLIEKTNDTIKKLYKFSSELLSYKEEITIGTFTQGENPTAIISDSYNDKIILIGMSGPNSSIYRLIEDNLHFIEMIDNEPSTIIDFFYADNFLVRLGVAKILEGTGVTIIWEGSREGGAWHLISAIEKSFKKIIKCDGTNIIGITDHEVWLSTNNGDTWNDNNQFVTENMIEDIISLGNDMIFLSGTTLDNTPWGAKSIDNGYSWLTGEAIEKPYDSSLKLMAFNFENPELYYLNIPISTSDDINIVKRKIGSDFSAQNNQYIAQSAKLELSGFNNNYKFCSSTDWDYDSQFDFEYMNPLARLHDIYIGEDLQVIAGGKDLSTGRFIWVHRHSNLNTGSETWTTEHNNGYPTSDGIIKITSFQNVFFLCEKEDTYCRHYGLPYSDMNTLIDNVMYSPIAKSFTNMNDKVLIGTIHDATHEAQIQYQDPIEFTTRTVYTAEQNSLSSIQVICRIRSNGLIALEYSYLTNRTKILMSIDSGNLWDVFKITDHNFSSCISIGNQTLLLSEDNKLLITSNLFTTFTVVATFPKSTTIKNLYYIGYNIIIACGFIQDTNEGLIWISYNNAKDWEPLKLTTSPITSCAFDPVWKKLYMLSEVGAIYSKAF